MDDQHSDILTREGHTEKTGDAGGFSEPPPAAETRPARRSRLRPVLWLLLLAAVVAAAVVYLPRLAHQNKPTGRMMSSGPVPVGVASAKQGDMPVTLSGLGTVTPLATVTVKTQINGYLTNVGFHEGQHVKKGDFLAQIDPRPYQVAFEQAQGQLGKDQALLRNAQLDLKRYDTLVTQNSIARQTRDTQTSLVAQYRATLVSDQAQIDAQKLNLAYCHITSPVTGRVGLRQVDPGNYVQTSDTNGIVVVTQLQPISVIFTLPEDSLRQVLTQLRAGATLEATAYDRTGTVKIATGRLETVDNQIDTTTGTVKLRAIFDNADEALFPNQFVNIKLLVETVHNAVLVPNSAIQRGAPGTFVYVVKPGNTVAVQKVALGPTDGVNIVVASGLQPGARVVDDGADRLKAGAKVSIAPPPGVAAPAGAAAQPATAPTGRRGHRRGGTSPADQ